MRNDKQKARQCVGIFKKVGNGGHLIEGDSPREAASTIVKLVNSKNLNQAMLALTVSSLRPPIKTKRLNICTAVG